jgi:anti-sigma regulatory factor (Ser/Thr protein kinase)
MSADRVSYTLDSTLETVNNAEETAGRMATEAGFDDEEIMKISMAVREAAVNAVLHGNAYDPSKKVTLAFERTAHDLVIVIRDQGKGLDASKDSGPFGAGQPDENFGPRHFPDTLVHGCGGNPPVPDGHRT